jgi:hypothetical protein
MYCEYNPNPNGKRVGDCVIRAIAKAMNMSWDAAYASIALQGYLMKDIMSSNVVWGEYLRRHGYKRYVIPDTCPDCYTVREFCEDHPEGKYILATGSHVVVAEDGCYFDAWDSGDETPVYFWRLRDAVQL